MNINSGRKGSPRCVHPDLEKDAQTKLPTYQFLDSGLGDCDLLPFRFSVITAFYLRYEVGIIYRVQQCPLYLFFFKKFDIDPRFVRGGKKEKPALSEVTCINDNSGQHDAESNETRAQQRWLPVPAVAAAK
ncbi:hypothetical protein T310_6359 [Rasamsonia emersonii CBS 393.64]|uniref:Uncharacterized protein n=1 Tax=Rasamsonia emersonii (strain ATCC 16479 / CBS 393.64 / IMI 116815) TaxID=1408163 RepID=A0A0F4YPX7_RASE3|nr:hypothetical protein T310_6359 [Rasamsonia emersonii CBS 393.64]KKA19673.1 hypothetical protein T310_6359 [Rasamsonia emersonii CBS 393.64]